MQEVRDVSDLGARRKRAKRFGYFIFAFVAVALASLTFLWVVLRSGIFSARSVSVDGLKTVSEDQVLTLLRSRIFEESFPKYVMGYRNLLVWPEELSGEALLLLPQVKRIAIETSYARREVRVHVEERNRRGIWCFVATSGERACSWFDDEGFLIEHVAGAAGSLILVVHDYSDPPRIEGRYVLPRESFGNLLSVLRLVETTDLVVREIAINKNALEEVRVEQESGPLLYFSLRFPLVGGEAALSSLKETANFDKLRSVDFRVQNRVYYK